MKNQFPREFYTPKGATLVADAQSSAVAYTYEAAGATYAMGFRGKAQKPSFHYRYRSTERRDQAIQEFFANVRSSEKFRADQRAARKAWVNDYKVGDVLYTSWGYDQTNVDYFQVIEVRGKQVLIREIGKEYEETSYMSGRSIPTPNQFIGAATRHLAQQGGIKISSCQTAWRLGFKEVAGVKIYESRHESSYA